MPTVSQVRPKTRNETLKPSDTSGVKYAAEQCLKQFDVLGHYDINAKKEALKCRNTLVSTLDTLKQRQITRAKILKLENQNLNKFQKAQ